MQGYDKPDANQEHLGQWVQRIAGFTNDKIQAHFDNFTLETRWCKCDKGLSGGYRFIGEICGCILCLLPENGGGEQGDVCQSAGRVPMLGSLFLFLNANPRCFEQQCCVLPYPCDARTGLSV